MNYKGIIIEESLSDKSLLKELKIISTEIEEVTEAEQTPWLKKWTLYTVEIPDDQIVVMVEKISKALEGEHVWYADFKNEKHHYIVFRGKIFKVDRNKPLEYEEAKKYGLSLGIPDYQLDLSPNIK